MIFPFFGQIKNILNYPMTLALVFFNLIVFALVFQGHSSKAYKSDFVSIEMLEISGRLYHQYLGSQGGSFEAQPYGSENHHLDMNDRGHRISLGLRALRDRQFLKVAPQREFVGDVVQIQHWKSTSVDFLKEIEKSHSQIFGLSRQSGLLTWLTFQFSHISWFHLLSNMIMLFFVGVLIERAFGGGLLLKLYLIGGLGGGLLYLIGQEGGAPVVGASASISALIGFCCFYWGRQSIPYFYYIWPVKGLYGVIYLPAYYLLALFIAKDFAGLVQELGGAQEAVAYSAHVGGMLVGLLWALAYRYKSTPQVSAIEINTKIVDL